MPIPSLSPTELEQVNTAKQVANDKLSEWRRDLTKKRKTLSKRELAKLENQFAFYKRVLRKPVIVVIDGAEICLDYELLNKFIRKIERQKFMFRGMGVIGSDIERKLVISYRGTPHSSTYGTIELHELSPRQRDLLHGLPRIELQERF